MFAIANGSIAMDNKNHVYITNKDMLTVTMIHAYDGDCFLVRTKNHVTLIDTGDSSETTRNKLISTLQDNNITRINNMIVTNDLDHCAGNLDFLLNKTEENTTAYPWLKNIIVENIYYNGFKTIPGNVTKKPAYAEDVLDLGDNLYFVVLSPTKKIIQKAKAFGADRLDDMNDLANLSVFGRLQYQSFSILFTSYAQTFRGISVYFRDYLVRGGMPGEQPYKEYDDGLWTFIQNKYIIKETVGEKVFQYAPELKCTVFKTSGTQGNFDRPVALRCTQATHVLCSSSDNPNGPVTAYPQQTCIETIRDNAPYVQRNTFYITRYHGNVTLLSDGTNVLVSCENKNINWLNELNAYCKERWPTEEGNPIWEETIW